jgi:lipopolysaccharide/colanic/teichoic acid biosynthesis glycosyltransferase
VVDVVAASAALVVLSPLFVVIASAVRMSIGSPVLFRQGRIGFRSSPFTIYKFRTMRDGDGGDAERLTAFGRLLRSWSLDEIPQLWNVLRGDMSIVGPRPLLPEYLPRYSMRHRRRHDVRPGITGWSAVNGRNELSWEEQLEMDVWYIENQSLALDFRIMWLTVWHVLGRKGVNQPGHITRERLDESGHV